MKKVAVKQYPEVVQERVSADHLNSRTTLFDLEGFDKNIDPETVEVIRKRVQIYLESWVRPNLEKAINELK